MMEIDAFVVVVLAVIVLVIAAAWAGRRASRAGENVCKACGAANPGLAHFCRRCGKNL